MTGALILATAAAPDGTSAALVPLGAQTPVERLIAQVGSLGAQHVTVLTRAAWVADIRTAAGTGVDVRADTLDDVLTRFEAGGVLVADAHGAGHDPVVEWVVRDGDTACLVDAADQPLGLLFVAAGDRGAVAAAAAGVGGHGDVSSLCRALDGGVSPRRVTTGPLHWAPAADAAQAADAFRRVAVDADALLLANAVKSDDSFFPTFFVSPYSRYIARWAARRGFSPNQITVVSFSIGLAAAGCFALGTRVGLVAGAILLQASFTADCVDGQVARYARRFSPVGAWLDSTFDRLKEYIVYAGLAVGGVRAGGDDAIWILAAAALTLQTVRHMAVFGYEERTAVPAPPRAKVADAGVRALSRADRIPALRWAKRIVVLPIGERFALISIAAAVSTPRTTFVWLLAWGSIATAYIVAGRLLRSVG